MEEQNPQFLLIQLRLVIFILPGPQALLLLAATQWNDARLSLETLFMQGMFLKNCNQHAHTLDEVTMTPHCTIEARQALQYDVM